MLWEPTDYLSVLLNGSHVDRDTTCCGADSVQSYSVNTELDKVCAEKHESVPKKGQRRAKEGPKKGQRRAKPVFNNDK